MIYKYQRVITIALVWIAIMVGIGVSYHAGMTRTPVNVMRSVTITEYIEDGIPKRIVDTVNYTGDDLARIMGGSCNEQ